MSFRSKHPGAQCVHFTHIAAKNLWLIAEFSTILQPNLCWGNGSNEAKCWKIYSDLRQKAMVMIDVHIAFDLFPFISCTIFFPFLGGNRKNISAINGFPQFIRPAWPTSIFHVSVLDAHLSWHLCENQPSISAAPVTIGTIVTIGNYFAICAYHLSTITTISCDFTPCNFHPRFAPQKHGFRTKDSREREDTWIPRHVFTKNLTTAADSWEKKHGMVLCLVTADSTHSPISPKTPFFLELEPTNVSV